KSRAASHPRFMPCPPMGLTTWAASPHKMVSIRELMVNSLADGPFNFFSLVSGTVLVGFNDPAPPVLWQRKGVYESFITQKNRRIRTKAGVVGKIPHYVGTRVVFSVKGDTGLVSDKAVFAIAAN